MYIRVIIEQNKNKMKEEVLEQLREDAAKVFSLIENMDEAVYKSLSQAIYASNEFKEAQRISNALLRLSIALDNLTHEL